MLVGCSYTISEHLSGMKHLRYLALGSSGTATFGGGIEQLPSLRTLALTCIFASGAAVVASKCLTRLTTCGMVRHHNILTFTYVCAPLIRHETCCHVHCTNLQGNSDTLSLF